MQSRWGSGGQRVRLSPNTTAILVKRRRLGHRRAVERGLPLKPRPGPSSPQTGREPSMGPPICATSLWEPWQADTGGNTTAGDPIEGCLGTRRYSDFSGGLPCFEMKGWEGNTLQKRPACGGLEVGAPSISDGHPYPFHCDALLDRCHLNTCRMRRAVLSLGDTCSSACVVTKPQEEPACWRGVGMYTTEPGDAGQLLTRKSCQCSKAGWGRSGVTQWDKKGGDPGEGEAG